MVDFGESDKMIKISRKVDKSNTYNGFSGNISYFIQGRTSSDSKYIFLLKNAPVFTGVSCKSEKVLTWIKNEILPLNPP